MPKKNENPLISGIPDDELLKALEVEFPGVTRSILSYLKRPDQYGITFTTAAKRRIKKRFGITFGVARPRKNNYGHSGQTRKGAWMDAGEAAAFELAVMNDQFHETETDVIRALIREYSAAFL